MRHSQLTVRFGFFLLVVHACASGSFGGGIAGNRPTAFLVFPYFLATSFPDPTVETFLTITNTSSQSVVAHVALIHGDYTESYCRECGLDVPLPGLSSRTLVLSRESSLTRVRNIDTGVVRSCTGAKGFVTVDAEDSNHVVVSENVLLGNGEVVNYDEGWTIGLEAIGISAAGNDGNRAFRFDGFEYGRFPLQLSTEFLAPGIAGPLDASLVLFTMAFERGVPPLADCTVQGVDAFGSVFTSYIQFGCWTKIELRDVDPEFAYPFLGANPSGQEHGWLQLVCNVYGTGDNQQTVVGGVHGALVQLANPDTRLRRFPPGPLLPSASAWGRVLSRSPLDGDPMTFHLMDVAP